MKTTFTIVYDDRVIRYDSYKSKEDATAQLKFIADTWRNKKECRILEDKETAFSFNIGNKDFVCSIQ